MVESAFTGPIRPGQPQRRRDAGPAAGSSLGGPGFGSLELAVDEANRAFAVGFNADQKAGGIRRRLVMGIRLGLKKFNHLPPAPRGIHRIKVGRERTGGGVAAQGECLRALQHGFDGPPQPGPEFHLAAMDRSRASPVSPGVEDQGVGKFHRLTHGHTVAFGCPISIPR